MKTLCRELRLPDAVTQAVLAIHQDPGFQPDCAGLRRQEDWAECLDRLARTLGPDPQGFRLLCCMLRCALAARADYDRLGLSREIWLDTFGCFTRFVEEHRESYGAYGFDRGFWTVRQVSCRLFRIGQLEYELTERDGLPAVSLHIPSDARLELPLLRQSWQQARTLLERLYPDHAAGLWYCKSWLLSPDLGQLLSPGSRILDFQSGFHITPASGSTGGYALWVFKNPRLAPADYPENTTLQRRLKAWLLAGNAFHDGFGQLKDQPFDQTAFR